MSHYAIFPFYRSMPSMPGRVSSFCDDSIIHELNTKDYKPILDCVVDLDIVDKLNNLSQVPDRSEIKHGLKIIDGWRYMICLYFRTTTEEYIEKDISKNHRIERRNLGKNIVERVSLQS